MRRAASRLINFDGPMTTLEELKRKEKSVTRLFRLFMVIMTLIVVLLAAWIIAYIDLP